MGNWMGAGTLRAGKTPEEGAGEVPRDGKGGHLLSSFRETVERPEMKELENIERRTFRAVPEEGAWERTTSGWLYPSQVPSMQVVQLLSAALFQTQNFMS